MSPFAGQGVKRRVKKTRHVGSVAAARTAFEHFFFRTSCTATFPTRLYGRLSALRQTPTATAMAGLRRPGRVPAPVDEVQSAA